MKRSLLVVFPLVLVLAGASQMPAVAASKDKAWSLLTGAELEAALHAKVTRTAERDTVINTGPYKGETMSGCDWVVGESTYVNLLVMRQILSGAERAAGLATFQKAYEDLKKAGWTVEQVNLARISCSTARPPASESSALPSVGCFGESKGFAFGVGVTTRATVTPQQVKTLVDKVVARLP